MSITKKSIEFFESIGNRDYAIVPHIPSGGVQVFDRRVLRFSWTSVKPWKTDPLPLWKERFPDYESAMNAIMCHLTNRLQADAVPASESAG